MDFLDILDIIELDVTRCLPELAVLVLGTLMVWRYPKALPLLCGIVAALTVWYAHRAADADLNTMDCAVRIPAVIILDAMILIATNIVTIVTLTVMCFMPKYLRESPSLLGKNICTHALCCSCGANSVALAHFCTTVYYILDRFY